ncbi:hypothetical protein [Lewinella sp. LCG006]|uniref:hypothetical protein n=1 Tax=Lewinella sp. LCG006 TaxID=3231911 RepID=UPI00346077CB
MKNLLCFFLCFGLLACSQDAATPLSSSNTGQGGSLARFTVVGDFLYTLEVNTLKWFKTEENGSLTPKGEVSLNEGQETIFPLDGLLFLGSTAGLSIFEISSTGEPVFHSQVEHVVGCDPVVANEEFAFVTLRIQSCAGLFRPLVTEDVLNIYNVEDIMNPTPVASYPMNDPRGLGLAGDLLFLCEGANGLKVLDVSDVQQVNTISQLTNIHANDVIVLNDKLLVIGPEAILQYDYADPVNLQLVSTINL